MQPPKTLRHVQQLTSHLVALSRFIRKLGEKALPFYRLLWKTDKFTWTEEAHAAFDDLKRRLSTSPVLVTPREKEPMLLYIAATNQVVSSALVVECAEDDKEHGVQRPVYYLSEVLSPTKQRYPRYQKLAYAIYMTGKKLPHYFECNSIIVVASTLVSSILNNPDAMGRFALGYYPRTMGDQVPATISNQVASPAGFHRRVDRSTDARTPRLVELMDNIRRRFQARFGSRSRSGPRITTGGQDALRLAYAICEPLEQRS
jgi:hypothetical protein